jgi:hypothetical protein
MRVAKLVLGFSLHMPMGSAPAEFEACYQTRIRPLLTRIYANPGLPACLHLSGSTLVSLDTAHPEIVMLIKELARRKQVEILGGGYAHPYLHIVPLADRLGQIEQATTLLRQAFDKRPRGCLLAGMAWEPQLASTLSAAGMDYTFVSDALIESAGCDPRCPQVVEDQGRSVIVFPARELVHFPEGAALSRSLEQDFRGGTGILCYLISVCPEGNQESKEGFEAESERFFKSLLALSEDYSLTLPSRHLKEDYVRGRTYLAPSGSRLRLAKSVQNARLYGKMYYVHGLANQLRGDKARKKATREGIWRAQGHEAYPDAEAACGQAAWRARASAYRELLEAESITREKGMFMPSLVALDYDFDGYEEYIYQGSDMNAYLHRRGATIVELDLFAPIANLLNLPECGPEDPDALFLDFFIHRDADEGRAETPAGSTPGTHAAETRGLWELQAPFTLESMEAGRSEIKLVREWESGANPTLGSGSDGGSPLRLEKRFAFRRNGIILSLGLVNIGNKALSGVYESRSGLMVPLREPAECRLSLRSSEGVEEARPGQHLKMDGTEALALIDGRGKAIVDFMADGEPTCRAYLNEVGYASFAFAWKLALLRPGERFQAVLQFTIHPRRTRGGD